MKNISLKKLMLALLLTAAVPTLTAQVHVGDILCEGNLIYPPSTYPASGATAIGVIFYVDNTGQHGWAVALEEGSYQWCASWENSNTPLVNYSENRQAIYDLDGYTNTQIVRAQGTQYTAFYVVDFENGWYVPAIGQLNYLYGNFVEVNASLQKVGGSQMTNGSYWSSTQNSGSDAWFMTSSGELVPYYSGTGQYYIYSYHKFVYRGVRGVRNF